MAFSLDQDSDRPAERALRSLAPQCLKSCERCAISVSDSGQLFLMPLFPEQLDFDPRGAATWLADQARLYYGLLSGVAWSAPFSDQAGLEEAFGACSRAAELFFYARNAGKSLEASRRSLPSRAVLDELERALPGPGWQSADALRDFRSVAARAADLDLPPGFLKAICSRSAAYLAATGGRDEGARAAARSAVAAIAEADSDGRLLEAVALTLDPDALVSSAPRACRPEIKLVLERLDSRLADRVSVPDLAREAGLSESYLCTVFKAQVGKSIVGYVNDKRLERAMDLLRTGRYLVKEAASEVGLDDPFYFNRLFKRRFGISPSSVIP
jgi:AraC-type DNA-binding domain-containing proteins